MHTMHRGRPQGAQPPALRNLRKEKLSLTTTPITKVLTDPLAQLGSTADLGDQSPASGPVHLTGQLSMAWKRSADSSRAGQEIQTAPPHS